MHKVRPVTLRFRDRRRGANGCIAGTGHGSHGGARRTAMAKSVPMSCILARRFESAVVDSKMAREASFAATAATAASYSMTDATEDDYRRPPRQLLVQEGVELRNLLPPNPSPVDLALDPQRVRRDEPSVASLARVGSRLGQNLGEERQRSGKNNGPCDTMQRFCPLNSQDAGLFHCRRR